MNIIGARLFTLVAVVVLGLAMAACNASANDGDGGRTEGNGGSVTAPSGDDGTSIERGEAGPTEDDAAAGDAEPGSTGDGLDGAPGGTGDADSVPGASTGDGAGDAGDGASDCEGPDCPVSSDDPGTSGPADPSTRPADPGYVPGGGDLAPTLAPIENIELLVRESAPPQYALQIVSGLPGGCAEFLSATVERELEYVFSVQVLNLEPVEGSDMVCTMIYGTHDSTVELGSDLESGAEYTVYVNDEEFTFTAQ